MPVAGLKRIDFCSAGDILCLLTVCSAKYWGNENDHAVFYEDDNNFSTSVLLVTKMKNDETFVHFSLN